jgi:hypothetical protein
LSIIAITPLCSSDAQLFSNSDAKPFANWTNVRKCLMSKDETRIFKAAAQITSRNQFPKYWERPN